MPVDHNRPLPVAPERLDAVTKMLWPTLTFARLQRGHQIDVMKIALQAALVEQQEEATALLREAYHIYNARWR